MSNIQNYIDGFFYNSTEPAQLLAGYVGISDPTLFNQTKQQIVALGQGHVTGD